jgi:hypothetical protein
MAMIGTIVKKTGMSERGREWSGLRFILPLLLMVLLAAPALGRMDVENPIVEMGYNPGGAFVLDG